MNKEMDEYFKWIDEEVKKEYKIANEARAMGYDAEKTVNIPLAKNMAEKVVGLISVVAPQIVNTGIAERISELENKFGKLDWRVALTIAEEVTRERFCKFKSKLEAMEVGIRIGIAYITIGVVASPLEGFVRLQLKKRRDGNDYICAYFSGPIRSAGGTAASVSVIITDYIRKKMGYMTYDPAEEEVKRMIVEMQDYHDRITNLQYFPSEEEATFMLQNLPVQVDGDPSEELDVSNYKDLDRIETNKLRNGPCLVVAEGLTQKAPKLWKNISKWGKDFDLDSWNFLEKFLEIQKKNKMKGSAVKSDLKIKPDFTFINDLVAGRPVLTYPLRVGGLRLRYGRSRNTGLSSAGINPATMYLLNNYIAIGTQLKLERPGKGTALGSCDDIDGSIVKLNNGNVLFLDTVEDAIKYSESVKEILFLGDILINYGDFSNRGHSLIPVGYCEEWWHQEVKKAKPDFKIDNIRKVSFEQAYEISKKYNVPLHPRYIFYWSTISIEEFFRLLDWLEKGSKKGESFVLPLDLEAKRVLELIGLPHKVIDRDFVVIEGDWVKAFFANLGLLEKGLDKNYIKTLQGSVLEIVNDISGLIIRDKSGTYIGARMGRPEKAKLRKLTGSPHVLFPVGDEGGRTRSFQSALDAGSVSAEMPLYFCSNCNNETIYPVCELCNKETKKIFFCKTCKKIVNEKCDEGHSVVSYDFKNINIKTYIDSAKAKLKINELPAILKGVRGTFSKNHFVEHLVKGILRALHNLYVNKDGTIRYDMTELPLTAFKPREIGTSVKKLRELGYIKDINGNELANDDQLLELRPQDVVLPSCNESPDEGADEILFRVAGFIDDLLEKLYGLPRFYNLNDKNDLVGHLVVGLAPHISVGMVGRIIGFSKTQGLYAHPLFHCACRRDCDGDELSVDLLMDNLINFSRTYLPAHRGGVQDASLVLSSTLIPSEVDDMAFDVDVVTEYPLDLYEAALNYKPINEIKIEQLKTRLGKDNQFIFGFTHNISDINFGVRCSAYKSLPTMEEKVLGQMALAEKIRAVDQADVARLVIERHFIRDIKGNLRKFSTQEFRCIKCNEKFRRPPLIGVCTKCKGKIVFTVSEGSIVKYLIPSMSLAEKYNLPPFLRQTLELTKKSIDSIFGVEKDKQEGLGKWFG